VIFLLFFRERTIEETKRHRTVGKLKNLGNEIVKRSENGDKERDDRSKKEKDIRTLPPYVQSLRYNSVMFLAASQGGRALKHSVWRAFLVPRIRVGQTQLRSKRMQRLGAVMVTGRCISMHFSIYEVKSIFYAVGKPTQTIRSFTRHTIRIVEKNKK